MVLRQPPTDQLRAILRDDRRVAVWWGSVIECTAAIARRYKGREITIEAMTAAYAVLARTSRGWWTVAPTPDVKSVAIRATRVHALRAPDALQLAAALDWANRRPTGHGFVTLDRQLRDAARLEGFEVLPA